MKIINRTHWRTDHLRAFLSRVAETELTAGRRKRLTIELKYNRQKDRGLCSGHAQCPGDRMTVMVPSLLVNKVDLAMVIAHEMAHTRGVRHAAMRGNPAYRRVHPRTESIYSWAVDQPLEMKPKRTRTTPEQNLEAKVQKVQVMVDRKSVM